MDDKARIHACYIVGILVAVIVLLATVNLGQVQKLVEYFSFSLTLSSLLLAILAIVYSFVSNSQLTTTLGSISSVSSALGRSTNTLEVTAEKLAKEVAALPSSIDDISGKIERTHSLIEELGKTPDGASFTVEDGRRTEDVVGAVTAEAFLNSSSTLGVLVVYVLHLAEEKQLAFKFKDFWEEVELDYEYVLGFIVAMASSGLLQYRLSKEIISLVDVRDDIGVGAYGAVLQRIENWKEGDETDQRMASALEAKLALVKESIEEF